jgi:hypothetical protein
MSKVSNKSNKILVTYESNWADKIDVQASMITTIKEWKEICDQAKIAFTQCEKCSHYVGSNQEIEYYTYEEWLDCYTVKELTQTEYKVLSKFDNLLNKYRFFIPEY